MNNPKISILCPTYNHEKFVGYFIDSLLTQSEQDFELIIVDDCSADKNVEEIKKFSDPRIKLIQHEYNQGINAGLNDAFFAAKGEYCAIIASDDMFEPNYLEFTSQYLDQNKDIAVVYCSYLLIDDNNQVIKKNKPWIQNNRDRFKILREMFMDGNVVLSPGMVVRRDILAKIMPLDLSMFHHQDYGMHINLLMKNNAYLTTKQLVKYRIISGEKNASAQNAVTRKREDLEQPKLMDIFLQIKDVEFFKKIFGDKLNEFGEPISETVPYFLGRLALCSRNQEKQNWGYRVIMDFIREKKNLDLLNNLYGFNFGQYISLVKKFVIDDVEKKYRKYRRLFNISLLAIFGFTFYFVGSLLQ
ncbi:MAG: glycosyltransferase, family 2 [Rickettsiaceae bacterium]|jgi:glycosyltransferase involved in cell wall biosynthesis|nr:glycosyltransferase, family 2 [Rickettsiaceae bacterium]